VASVNPRYAIYFVPAADSALYRFGAAVLGYDCYTGNDAGFPDPLPMENAAWRDLIGAPRRYGFHATLKPPMRLTGSLDDFLADAQSLAQRLETFALPKLSVQKIGRFIALCPTSPSPALQALADACVTELDTHRLPEDAAAMAKRANGRSPQQLAYLERWGYPHVLEDWRFHMTLTNSSDNDFLLPIAEEYFADALALERRVENLTVFIEPAPNTPFQILQHFRLGQ
jgi:Protein of unknown function (DUF1045)